MRLWHEKLIPFLPRQQLLGQHRECCALRGNGWGKKHATVDYVFHHSPYTLYQYHRLVMGEMERRGYRPDPVWKNPAHRGKRCSPYRDEEMKVSEETQPLYPEHNDTYLAECLENLEEKNIQLPFTVRGIFSADAAKAFPNREP